jgi:hypothetical protein
MCFTIDPNGIPIPMYFPDTGTVAGTSGASAEGNAQTPPSGDWILVVTAVPAGTSAATVAALILSSPLALPMPWGSKRWKVAYGSLGSAFTASVYT